MMEFRRATEQDVDRIMEIIEQARALFKQSGIPQWQNGYPDAAAIRRDVRAGCSYVLCAQGEICATAAIPMADEPNYRTIEGAWLCDGPYAAIHRIAVDPAFKKQGLASLLVDNAVRLARENGRRSLRCDTHECNRPMRGMLEKNGFALCGKIHLLDDHLAPRVAYERPL